MKLSLGVIDKQFDGEEPRIDRRDAKLDSVKAECSEEMESGLKER